MNNLLHFILKQIHWLLFFFLIALSLHLLFNNSEFQRSKYLSVFQEIAGRVYTVSNSVQSYLNLRTTNAGLMQRIGALEEELQQHKFQLENLAEHLQTDIAIGFDESVLRYIPARVTHNQISEARNYILLNKGSKHGITEDMGVVSAKGIVGVVTHVTTNFSRVIPVLSSGYHPSGIIKNTRFFGPLLWDGKDPRYIHLSRLPSHASYAIGDTVVTSGYSATFPEGVLVGVIEDTFSRQQNEEYNSLRVRLFTDFSTLDEVFIIRNPLQEERSQIERGVSRQ